MSPGTIAVLPRNQSGTSSLETGSEPPRSEGTGLGNHQNNQSRTITLPWSVLVGDNQRHGLLRGRILLTTKYRTALSAASSLAAFQWKAPALKSGVCVRVTLYEPDKRRRDIGNYVKLIADALTRIAFVDDSQIDELTLVRGGLDRSTPRAEIEVLPR